MRYSEVTHRFANTQNSEHVKTGVVDECEVLQSAEQIRFTRGSKPEFPEKVYGCRHEKESQWY